MAICQNWCTVDDLCCDSTKYTEEEIAEAILGASQVLSRSSYNRYGVCDYIVAPCSAQCSDPCLGCQGYAVRVNVIAGAEIQDVTAINVIDEDGNETTRSTEGLWWVGDTIFFPTGYDFPAQSAGKIGAEGTWNIELTAGRPVPVLGKKAAIELAMKFLENPCDNDCAVPEGLKSVTRDGGTWELVDSSEAYMLLPKVSMFVEAYGQKKKWSGIVSPLNVKGQLVQ